MPVLSTSRSDSELTTVPEPAFCLLEDASEADLEADLEAQLDADLEDDTPEGRDTSADPDTDPFHVLADQGASWETLTEAFETVHRVGEENGIIIRKRRTHNRKDGTLCGYTLECGHARQSIDTPRIRKGAKNKKDNCSWSARIHQEKSRPKDGGELGKVKFYFVTKTEGGSHTLLDKHTGHTPNYQAVRRQAHSRRYQRNRNPVALKYICDHAGDPNLSSQQIASTIQMLFGINITGADINNLRRNIRVKERGTLTSTQQFLSTLYSTDGIWYRIHREDEDDPTSRIKHVFWAYPWQIKMLKDFPEVIAFDSTYKVNRFNMPLLQATGMTPIGSNYSCIFALISDEREEAFRWVLQRFLELLDAHDIPHPHVILSDLDRAFKNAALDTFNNDRTKQQICLWHLMKNVVHNVKKKWNGSLDGTIVGEYGGGVGSGIKSNTLTLEEDLAFKEGHITEAEAELLLVEKDVRSGYIAAGMSLLFTCAS